MNRKLLHSAALCAALVLAFISLPAPAEELKGEKITAIITGKTISGYNIDNRQNITWYFAPDGLVKLRRNDIIWKGKWRIDDIGRLCVQFRDPYSDVIRKEGCRILAMENDKLVMYGLSQDGQRAGETMSIQEILDGNANNL